MGIAAIANDYFVRLLGSAVGKEITSSIKKELLGNREFFFNRGKNLVLIKIMKLAITLIPEHELYSLT